jgi:SNF2 family DNA or RNA helicase
MEMNVDIKVSHQLDRLIFSSREKGDELKVHNRLFIGNPDIKFSRTAEGISVRAFDLPRLKLNDLGLVLKWSEPSKMFYENRIRTSKTLPNYVNKIKEIIAGGLITAKKYLDSRNGYQVLDDHQWVNVSCMTLPEGSGLCLFDEQGAGKTVSLIFAFDELVARDEIDFALIVAPKSMVSEWPVDFEKFMKDRYKVRSLIGTASDKLEIIRQPSDVIVTNFETIVALELDISALLRRFSGRCMIVVDESFFVKNLDAKRTQAIRRLREYCNRAFVLCGTPAPNAAEDLIQQFNIVDFGFTFNNSKIPKDRQLSVKIINEIIEGRGPFVRHLKSKVLPDLPGKKFQKIPIKLAPAQAELYFRISDELRSDLERIDDLTFEKNKLSYLARRSALLQICSHPCSIRKDYAETPGKIVIIDELLEDLIVKKKEKVILWSFYTAALSTLFERYNKFNPVRYDGSITDIGMRREAVRRFQEDKNTMLFIANPAAAGAGLNLQSARFAIYESMSNQAAHYLQSLDRIHRRGQDREVEYLILLCEGTLEISEYERLLRKEFTGQKLLGDLEESLTRKKLLLDLNNTDSFK